MFVIKSLPANTYIYVCNRHTYVCGLLGTVLTETRRWRQCKFHYDFNLFISFKNYLEMFKKKSQREKFKYNQSSSNANFY